jgi:DtxR family Mn-dependent transcriptional regulator
LQKTLLQKEGVITLDKNGEIKPTEKGYRQARQIVRCHRLAERLLTDVIGLEWSLVHDEACRWEHVISDEVERRLVEILGEPTMSPYGNPIPGLGELGVAAAVAAPVDATPLLELDLDGPAAVVVSRLAEPLQADQDAMGSLRRIGAVPGGVVEAQRTPVGVLLRGQGATITLGDAQAGHVYVRRAA